MITVASVWVKGHVGYDVKYVTRLARMVRAKMTRPYRFVCLTDDPRRFTSDDIEPIVIPNPRPQFAWWAKLHLFDPSKFSRGRVLYLDLDTLVVGSLDDIVDYPGRFALIPDAGQFAGVGMRKVVKRFNSSVMVFDAGSQRRLWDAWMPAVSERLWGDQDLIGEVCPLASQMPAVWFPRISTLKGNGPTQDARVVLCKVPKNALAARKWPWVRDVWERAA